MTPPKTIYVPDSFVPLWEEAEQLWGDSLASLVNQLVRKYVHERQAELAAARTGVGRIVVDMGPEDRSFQQAFRGRWLVDPHPDETRTGEEGFDAGAYWGVALTEKGNIAVYSAHCNGRGAPELDVYPTLEAAAEAGVPRDIVAMASAQAGGDFVIELDI